MIESLREIHSGSSIAVLGSSPTLELFAGKEDVAIACNGAANLDIHYDYFICADWHSHQKPWFYQSQKHGATRIIESHSCVYDETLYPDPELRKVLQEERFNQEGYLNFLPPPTIPPIQPHRWFCCHPTHLHQLTYLPDFLTYPLLLKGATIAGIGLQLAYIMGAREIHLYGCSLDNFSGTNYLHQDGSEGGTRDYHQANFDRLIQFCMNHEVPVFVHGPSQLEEGFQSDAEFQEV